MPVAFKKDAGSPTGYLRADNLQPNTAHPVDAFGTGCYIVHRDVFEALPKPWYKDVFSEDGMEKIMGEDIFFTTNAREAGFQPYYDTRCIAKHLVEASV